jgi:hypothetical protein
MQRRHETMMAKLRAGVSRGSLTTMLLLGLSATPLRAQPADSDKLTGRLIELLVKKGVLPREDAAALLAEAKEEQAKSVKAAPKPRPASVMPAAPDETPVAPGTVRVTYVPQIVRDQIAQQVASDLKLSLKNGGEPLAVAGAAPAGPERFHFFGDIRLRGELDQLPSTNAPQFPDFATLNSGSPFDISSNQASGVLPVLNTTHDRWRERLRARAGVDVQIDDGIMAEIRLATGNDGSPVSANQTFGQNGPFTKYAVWLDRAFIKADPTSWLTISAGRMPNPYWTTDLIYYDDLGFDGFAASVTPRLSKSLKAFFTAGAFPVFNTAFNFGSTSADSSFASRDAWLFGVQGGGEWQATKTVSAKFAAGYFSYSNIGGKISSPCTIVFSSDTCDTDNTRTLFPGNGNTMMPLRNIVMAPNNGNPQYFGLASGFHILDLHGKVDLTTFNPIVVSFETEFAANLSFDRTRALALGVNNFGASDHPDVGNKAWMIKVSAGTPEIEKRWDWNVSLAYKYLESDSVLASLNDPDFHLGGTNAKGFILGGNLGIAHNTWLTARWLSSTQVSGAPYVVDVVQVDLNARF